MSASQDHNRITVAEGPTKAQIRRWQRYLADEIAEGQIYRDLAQRSKRPEKDILNGLADAEERHAQHWRDLLGEHAKVRRRPSLHRDRKSTRLNSSHVAISYAVFCLKKKKSQRVNHINYNAYSVLYTASFL